jgi:hypothetical protein
MSEAADEAIVRILLADFANADSANKLNIIGAGITMIPFVPATNQTAPHAVVAKVSFPPRFVGESPAVELALEHDDGTLVTLPGQTGQQFLRVGHAQALKPAVSANVEVPPNTVRPSHQFVMHFANGLPLQPNRLYTWRIKIDHDTREEWTETFYVTTATPAPVIG